MFYQIFGYTFGLVMALNYYMFFIFFPSLINYFLDENEKQK